MSLSIEYPFAPLRDLAIEARIIKGEYVHWTLLLVINLPRNSLASLARIRVQVLITFPNTTVLAFEQYFTLSQEAHVRRLTGGLKGSLELSHSKQLSHASTEDALYQR